MLRKRTMWGATAILTIPFLLVAVFWGGHFLIRGSVPMARIDGVGISRLWDIATCGVLAFLALLTLRSEYCAQNGQLRAHAMAMAILSFLIVGGYGIIIETATQEKTAPLLLVVAVVMTLTPLLMHSNGKRKNAIREGPALGAMFLIGASFALTAVWGTPFGIALLLGGAVSLTSTIVWLRRKRAQRK